MEAIHQTASTINNGLKYLQENSLVIVTCVAVLWVIRGRIMQWLDPSQQGVTLASSSNKKQDERLNDMMRVRQKQQEEAERQSKLAAQERKVKEAEEKKRRNELNLKRKSLKAEEVLWGAMEVAIIPYNRGRLVRGRLQGSTAYC